MKKNNLKNYFPGGNTAQGFYSFYQYLPYQTERTFIIKGGPGTGKSTLMKKIAKKIIAAEHDLELHWCSSDSHSLDGIRSPSLKIAFLDGTHPHITDPVYPGIVEEIINLGQFWQRSKLLKHKQDIIKLFNIIKNNFQQVYHYLNLAHLITEKLDSYHLELLNNVSLNQKIKEFIDKNIDIQDKNKLASVRHLFASAITPEGPVHHYHNLSQNMTCYFLQGSICSTKSMILKKIAGKVKEAGLDLICLHYPLNPDKLEALFLPSLKIAIIDNNPYHLDTIQEKGEIIDLDKYINKKKLKASLLEIKTSQKYFQDMLQQAISYLRQAKQDHDQLENIYIQAMDFSGVDQLEQKISKEILPGK